MITIAKLLALHKCWGSFEQQLYDARIYLGTKIVMQYINEVPGCDVPIYGAIKGTKVFQ